MQRCDFVFQSDGFEFAFALGSFLLLFEIPLDNVILTQNDLSKCISA